VGKAKMLNPTWVATLVTDSPTSTACTARGRCSTTDNSTSTDPGPQLNVARERQTASRPIKATVNHQVKPMWAASVPANGRQSA